MVPQCSTKADALLLLLSLSLAVFIEEHRKEKFDSVVGALGSESEGGHSRGEDKKSGSMPSVRGLINDGALRWSRSVVKNKDLPPLFLNNQWSPM